MVLQWESVAKYTIIEQQHQKKDLCCFDTVDRSGADGWGVFLIEELKIYHGI